MELAMMNDPCVETQRTTGGCNCHDCRSYSDAWDAVWELPRPMNKFQLMTLIQKETGQDPITAERYMGILINTGVIAEREKNLFQ